MKILVSGSYGTGNAGDEVILAQLLECLGAHDVSVFSKNVRYTRAHFSVRALPEPAPFDPTSILKDLARMRLRRLWQRLTAIVAIYRTDIFLMGGGGVLSEVVDSVLRFILSQLRLADLLGRKVVLFSVGVGPLRSESGKRMLADTLNRCVDYVSVRDAHSRHLLLDCGVRQRINVIPDPAVNQRVERDRSLRARTRVGVNVYRTFSDPNVWPGQAPRLETLKDALVQIIRELIRDRGFEVALLPFGERGDWEFAREVRDVVSDEACTLAAFDGGYHGVLSELGRCRIMIGMRFHSCLIAMANGIPAICIDQQFKSERLLNDIGLRELLIELGDDRSRPGRKDVEPAEVSAAVDFILNAEDVIRRRLETYFGEQRIQFQKEVRALLDDWVAKR